MYKEYLAYLKDNPNGYWFRRKLYGWGWTPATWQAWVILALYLGVIVFTLRRVDAGTYSENDIPVDLIVPIAFATFILLLICLIKGEKPKWQWGIPKKDEHSS